MNDNQKIFVYVFLWAAIGVSMIVLMSKRWASQFDRFTGEGLGWADRLSGIAFMALAWPLLAAWLLFLEARYRATGSPVPAWPNPIQRGTAPELATPSETPLPPSSLMERMTPSGMKPLWIVLLVVIFFVIHVVTY